MIPAVILAAGAGRRMGGPKALLVVEGETLLQRTIRTALAAGCQTVIAVVGDWDTGPLEPGTVVVRNPGAAEGMARNPAAAPAIRFALILGLVLIESLALYTFAIIFVKVQ